MIALVDYPTWWWTPKDTPCDHYICANSNRCEFNGRRWNVSSTEMSQPHDILNCNGHCGHPFHTKEAIQLAQAHSRGVGWGDVVYVWDQEEAALETPEQRRAKELAEAKRIGQEKIEAEANRMAAYMADVRLKMGCKENRDKPKIQKPCKNLYYTPGVEGRMQPNVCSECWAHEYHCPKTGNLIIAEKGKECAYLHPGQPGWLKEWNTNRHHMPAGSVAPNRFSSLGNSSRPTYRKNK
jgi:hypothetical protein